MTDSQATSSTCSDLRVYQREILDAIAEIEAIKRACEEGRDRMLADRITCRYIKERHVIQEMINGVWYDRVELTVQNKPKQIVTPLIRHEKNQAPGFSVPASSLPSSDGKITL